MLKRIGPLAAIISLALYLLVLISSAISKPPEYLYVSIYSESFIETACQHLLLLVGFDTLIYRKYYDKPPILVGHQDYFLAPLPGSEALLVRETFTVRAVFISACYYKSLWRGLLLNSSLGNLLLLQR